MWTNGLRTDLIQIFMHAKKGKKLKYKHSTKLTKSENYKI